MPPSPPVVMILSWQNDHAAAAPKLPTGLPHHLAPCAWAQSSITTRLCLTAKALSPSMSQGQPARCTAIMALVRGVITLATVAGVMFCESRQTSANTGVAPAVTMALTDAKKVRGVTITSSPAPMPSTFKAKSSASVPLDSATACGTSHQAANSFSNSRHSCPVQ